jgi:isoleucyl-tRNA synthetase
VRGLAARPRRTQKEKMANPTDIKSTLNLPQTTFPMKASLPKAEPVQLAEWEAQGLYAQIQKARAGRPTYVLHDGPPYPTGAIHLGTALNKILKDMVVKSKTMAGFRSPYVPGWDCHGLPIETKVEKELGHKGAVSPGEFRKKCREFALFYVDQHRKDFKRLGVLGRWEDPYLTMSHEYEACIADSFLTFLEKGYVYRGLKPVYWCLHDSTALAEAEVEYEDHTSPSVWVKFPVVSGKSSHQLADLGGKVDALIWTTTPWTLPHNRALAFHPEYEYVVAETSHGLLLIAAERVGSLAKDIGVEATIVRGPWKGKELEGLQFAHPFLEGLRVPAVLADYVTLDQGTGIVHTAPGHGAEDYQTGQRYGLETYAPLDNQGRYTVGLPEYLGKTVFEANPIIVKLLRDRGMLVGEAKLTHSYPHCWRCHHPVIFRATEQWFIKLDGKSKFAEGKPLTLRGLALEAVPNVHWIPGWGEERMRQMLAERPDWCVSRQRFWGVPITVFYCGKCGKLFDNVPALRNVIEWFKKEGADAWFSRTPEELLPKGTLCPCGAGEWRKETDILDVWFDSGCSSLSVLGSAELPWPADLYLEGPDQFRGWFHSSLLVAEGVRDASPYRGVLTYGWALDEKGRPMSKSLGNVVLPSEVCDKWGADLLRLWVAAHDYTADIWMSENVMKQLAESYRKLRNTFRFALGNLNDFDPARDAVADADLLEIDAHMLWRTIKLLGQCYLKVPQLGLVNQGWYEGFEFHRVWHAIQDFATVDLSAFYFDLLKDRLYTSAPKSRERRSAQTAVYRIADCLVRLVAPILAFTAEEVWKHMPAVSGREQSVHLSTFPELNAALSNVDTQIDATSATRWDFLEKLRGLVLKKLEEARQLKKISGSLEAKVIVKLYEGFADILVDYEKKHPHGLEELFIVSQVQIEVDRGPGRQGGLAELASVVNIDIDRADGSKCERCWNYSTHVGESAKFPTLCERCLPVVEELLGGAVAAS